MEQARGSRDTAPLNDPTLGVGSRHPGGFNALMADGGVRFIKSGSTNPVSSQVLQGLATRKRSRNCQRS